MKLTTLLGTLLVATLLVVNALVERRRSCSCADDCWCRTSAGRRFRWVVPIRHAGKVGHFD